MISESLFQPAWWYRNPHVQTIWPSLLRRYPRPRYRRERIHTRDGDFLDLDWTGPVQASSLIMILHGLRGSSDSHYVRSLSYSLAELNIPSVVMHFRGCSGEPNRLPRSYHAGETGDVGYVVETLHQRFPGRFIGVTGYSLGGNVLLNYLNERGQHSGIDAAVAVSVPFSLAQCARRLEQGFSRVYQRRLVAEMKRSLQAKAQIMDLPIDTAQLAGCKTFYQFDEHVTAPIHGFGGADDYYERCSSAKALGAIQVSTLIIQSRDDPFLRERSIPSTGEISDAVTLELSHHGGHCGFVSGGGIFRNRCWLDRRIPEYFQGKISETQQTQ